MRTFPFLGIVIAVTLLSQVTLQNSIVEDFFDQIKERFWWPDSDSLNFYLVGDYGYTVNKTYVEQLFDVINKDVHYQKNGFIATAGDNVYENGITSVDDPQVLDLMGYFDKKYLKKLPIFPVYGNHDCYGNYRAYFELKDKYLNWQMDYQYYSKVLPIGNSNKKAGFLFLNGCLLACKGFTFGFCNKMKVNTSNTTDIDVHYDWIETTLKAWSEDPNMLWTGVAIHFPMFSVGDHGDTASLKQYLLPILRKYKVDAFLCGHDHSIQFMLSKPESAIEEKKQTELEVLESSRVLDEVECLDNVIINNAGGQVYKYKKGTALGNFLVGGSGDQIGGICPDIPTDGELIYADNIGNSFARFELTEQVFRAQYFSHEGKETFRIEIEA